jgi:hypothetical protein
MLSLERRRWVLVALILLAFALRIYRSTAVQPLASSLNPCSR